jgi:hypothetical protein
MSFFQNKIFFDRNIQNQNATRKKLQKKNKNFYALSLVYRWEHLKYGKIAIYGQSLNF